MVATTRLRKFTESRVKKFTIMRNTRSSTQTSASDILAVIFSHNKSEASHARLRTAASTWLRRVPHVFYSDVDAASPKTTTLPRHLDNHIGELGRDYRAHTNGDWKAMASILAANRTHAGSFRWLLLADDDTVVVLPRLLRLLREADHTAPLYLGTYITGRDSCERTNTCCGDWRLPCSVPLPQCARGSSSSSSSPVISPCDMNAAGEVTRRCESCACPVRVHARDAAGRPVYRLDAQTGRAAVAPQVSYAYGGAGIILSAGLLNAMDAPAFEDCARRSVCGSGDFRVGSCIRTVSGHGVGFLPEPASKTGQLNRLGVEVTIAAKLAEMNASEHATYVARLTGLFGESESSRAHQELIVATLLSRYGPVRGGKWPWAFHPVKNAHVAHAIVEAQHVRPRRAGRIQHANESLRLVADELAEQVRRQQPLVYRSRRQVDLQLRGLRFPPER